MSTETTLSSHQLLWIYRLQPFLSLNYPLVFVSLFKQHTDHGKCLCSFTHRQVPSTVSLSCSLLSFWQNIHIGIHLYGSSCLEQLGSGEDDCATGQMDINKVWQSQWLGSDLIVTDSLISLLLWFPNDHLSCLHTAPMSYTPSCPFLSDLLTCYKEKSSQYRRDAPSY
jgi:hypothetical protein